MRALTSMAGFLLTPEQGPGLGGVVDGVPEVADLARRLVDVEPVEVPR
jgi:hypothetical protein